MTQAEKLQAQIDALLARIEHLEFHLSENATITDCKTCYHKNLYG